MRQIFCLVAAACVCARPVAGQGVRSDSVAALATIDGFHAALAADDSARVISMLGSGLLVIESGEIQTRAEYLAGHLRADIQASQGNKGVRSVVAASVIGDVAYITSRTVTTTTGTQGPTTSESAELVILIKSAGEWKLQAVHWSSRRIRR